jgi:hypothetical protein
VPVADVGIHHHQKAAVFATDRDARRILRRRLVGGIDHVHCTVSGEWALA